MQEVEGWKVHGELDYMKLKGDTGPLVYPGGFMHLFAFLRDLAGNSGRGKEAIVRMQWVYFALYMATQAVALYLFRKARFGSPWMALLFVLSKRMHSLYYLRLFNDCWAMLSHYVAIALFSNHFWLWGTIFWSLGLSVKMNGLLFLPMIGLLLLRNCGALRTTLYMLCAVTVQIVAGYPFLFAYPLSYFSRSFEFDRQFLHQWTVNWKFLSPKTFTSPGFATLLLTCHIVSLLLLCHFRWCAVDGGLHGVLRSVYKYATLRRSSGRTGTVDATVESEGTSIPLDAEVFGATKDSGNAATIQHLQDAKQEKRHVQEALRIIRDRRRARERFESDDVEDVGRDGPGSRGGVKGGKTSVSTRLRGTLSSPLESGDKKRTRQEGNADTGANGDDPEFDEFEMELYEAQSKAGLRNSGGVFTDSAGYIIYTLLACNFVGIVFSRTLHYQFYTWYWHALPFLFARTDFHPSMQVLLLFMIEYGFNVGDEHGAGNKLSSAVLTMAHLLLFASTCIAGLDNPLGEAGVPFPRTHPKRIKKRNSD